MLRNQHAYGNVETVKYHDAFPRPKDDPMAVGFKFGYWGERKFDPSNADLPPSRSVLPVHTTADDAKRSRSRSRSPSLWSPVGTSNGGRYRSSSPKTTGSSGEGGRAARSWSRQGSEGDSEHRDERDAGRSTPSRRRPSRSPSPRHDRELNEQDVERGRDGDGSEGKLISADARLVEAVLKLQRQNKALQADLEAEREAGRAAVRELKAEINERKMLEETLESAHRGTQRAKEYIRGLREEYSLLEANKQQSDSRIDLLEAQLKEITKRWRSAEQRATEAYRARGIAGLDDGVDSVNASGRPWDDRPFSWGSAPLDVHGDVSQKPIRRSSRDLVSA